MLVTQRVSQDALFHELDGRREAVFRIGDCVAPRLLAEVVFDGHRLAREIDAEDPGGRAAVPARARRRQRRACRPARGACLRSPSCRPGPRRRGAPANSSTTAPSAAERIDALLRTGGAESVVAVGRGAGEVIERCRRLAELHGARLAVSRPQVEAGRATRAELVGASGDTVSARAYVAFGISGALPHLVGMDGSATVVAVDRDRTARIFEHADLGVTADAGEMVDALLALAGDG